MTGWTMEGVGVVALLLAVLIIGLALLGSDQT